MTSIKKNSAVIGIKCCLACAWVEQEVLFDYEN